MKFLFSVFSLKKFKKKGYPTLPIIQKKSNKKVETKYIGLGNK